MEFAKIAKKLNQKEIYEKYEECRTTIDQYIVPSRPDLKEAFTDIENHPICKRFRAIIQSIDAKGVTIGHE